MHIYIYIRMFVITEKILKKMMMELMTMYTFSYMLIIILESRVVLYFVLSFTFFFFNSCI